MGSNFIPFRDADFLAWSRTFHAGILTLGTSIGVSTEQTTRYGDLNNTFQALMALVSSADTRTPTKVEEKRASRADLEAFARELARIINAHPDTTNAIRIQLGLTPRKDGRTPSPIPAYAPEVFIVSMNGHSMELELRDDEGKCRWPDGVEGASVLTRVGPELVLDPNAYVLQGNTTRTRGVVVDFPLDLDPGTKVWVTAFYRNAVDASGVAANPRSSLINFGDVMSPPAQLRKAA